MTTQPNIFDQLAQEDDVAEWSDLTSQPATQFSEIDTNEEGNIFEQIAQQEKMRKENEFGFLDTARDVGEQVVSKGLSGAGGAYGNILDALHLQPQEGEEVKNISPIPDIQADILDRSKDGKPLTAEEIFLLSQNEQIPGSERLPTSKDIQSGIQSFTGIGEGKTPAGRIAGRGAEFLGEGAVTGGGLKTLIGMGLSGVAGQGVREAGGPEYAAAATEIAGSLTPSIISKKLVPTSKSAKDIVEAGRQIGLSEAQITPLIQGEKKVATLSKVARKGTKTKRLFEEIKEKLGDSYNSIKARPDAKVKLPNADQIKLRKDFGHIRNELSKTLAPSPDKEAALNYIEKSLDTLRNVDITPEYLVNFWQDINKSVKWNSISGGKKALAQLKDPISDILHKVSPSLAKDFEMTNQLYTKYAQISKKLKPGFIDSFINKGELLAAPASALALVNGNPSMLIGLAGEYATRLLGREMLINPYFQNLGSKLVTNFNSGSVKAVTESVRQAKEYMERKYPQEDWSFLTED